MSIVINQNGKVLAETLTDSNLDAVKTTGRGEAPVFVSSRKIPPDSPFILSHIVERIANDSVR